MSVVRAIRPNTATKITNRFQPMYPPLKNVLLQPIVEVRPALYLSQKILVNKVFRNPPAQYPDHFGDDRACALHFEIAVARTRIATLIRADRLTDVQRNV